MQWTASYRIGSQAGQLEEGHLSLLIELKVFIPGSRKGSQVLLITKGEPQKEELFLGINDSLIGKRKKSGLGHRYWFSLKIHQLKENDCRKRK